MVKVCSIKSCSSGRKKVKKTKIEPHSLSFFQPRSETKLEKWSKSLGLKLKPSDNICHLHFKSENIKFYETIKIGDVVYLSYLDRKLLKDDAIPTIQHQFKIKVQKDLVYMPLTEVEQQVISSEQQSCDLTDSDEDKHPLQQDIEKFKKSVLQYKEQQQCNISIDSNDDTEDDQLTLVDFRNKMIDAAILPPYWLYEENPKQIDFMRLDPKSKQIKHHIRLNEDLSTTVIYANKEELNLKNRITSVGDAYNYLKSVEKWPVCVGTQIERIMYSKKCKGVIVGEDAYKRLQMSPRCRACRVLRSRFQSRPFACLTAAERITAQKRRIQTLVKQCRRLKYRVNKFKDLKLPKSEPEMICYKSSLDKTTEDIKTEVNYDVEVSDDVMLVNDGNMISYYEVIKEEVDDVAFIDDYEVAGDEIEISNKDDDEMVNDEVADRIFFEYVEKGDGDDKGDGIEEEEYSKRSSEPDDEGKSQRRSVTCEKCGVTLNSFSEYRSHLTSNHGAERKQLLKETFICEHCGKRYTCNSALKQHLATHGESNFRCDRCGKSCPTRWRLSCHMKSHNE